MNPYQGGPDEIMRTAVFGNVDGVDVYRYELRRTWEPFGQVVNFIMLNPSTADHAVDDPTIRRCMGFARSWGYGGLVVTNLYAFRTPYPRLLAAALATIDTIGPENDRHILRAAGEADKVVAAWGTGLKIHSRGRTVLAMLQEQGIAVEAIHLTADGTPCHPLYLPAVLVPKPITRPGQGSPTPR